MLQGGDAGPAIVAGKPAESLLIQALRHEGDLAMPPKKPKLAANIIADFERWITDGAPGPTASANTAEKKGDPRQHWAFQPVKRPAIPAVRNAKQPANAIDAFIFAKLEERGWTIAPPATRAEWIRRVTFDLTGLPPTPDEVDHYLADHDANADERVVDRLLASPAYGERWGQHWLDVVRFAETEGYEYDREIPDAWRYRDYVIDSFNRDKPFDRFLTEQIAGDEISPADQECMIATTFHRLGPVRRNAGNPEIALSRNEVLTERTDIIGTAFLGLTIGCARCHNHKLEPISQKDYYRLQAYLAATDEHNIVLASEAERKTSEAESNRFKDEIAALKKRMKLTTGPERAKLETELESLEDKMPAPLATIPATWNDMSHRTEIHVLKRGVWENKGEPVGPRPLGVLIAESEPESPANLTNPRTQLAKWITSPSHPLTARVMVNRVWLHHFGAGLVKTVNDFGTKGDAPSHRELLDWLASTFVENGWQLKPLHKMMVLSQTYRQSVHSPIAARAEVADPENRLLWRFNRRRLSAEEIRDGMLMVSGRLNPKRSGPSVMIPVDAEMVALLYKPSQWKPARDVNEYDRRSIYLFAKRNLRLPFLETFDAPPLLTSCARRETSTHAPQALELLNGKLANDLADAFAKRLEHEVGDQKDKIVERAFQLAHGRSATAEERRLSLEFLRDQSLKEFALAVLNTNGFLYVN